MAYQHIIDVSESDFDIQVLEYSSQAPVLVDFWAEWCIPCRVLAPILEKLARESNGAFRLARLNVDQNPRLAQQYNVRGIPAVKAFREGRVVAELTGSLPEGRVREFLRGVVPTHADLTLEKASSLADQAQWAAAEQAYRQVLTELPESPTALLGLARCLLAQNKANDSLEILRSFPPSREYGSAEVLRPLAEDMVRTSSSELSDDPLQAAYERSLQLVRRGNLEAAMDGLLDILRQNRRFRYGAARKAILAILELLGEQNPLTREYRSELASVLF